MQTNQKIPLEKGTLIFQGAFLIYLFFVSPRVLDFADEVIVEDRRLIGVGIFFIVILVLETVAMHWKTLHYLHLRKERGEEGFSGGHGTILFFYAWMFHLAFILMLWAFVLKCFLGEMEELPSWAPFLLIPIGFKELLVPFLQQHKSRTPEVDLPAAKLLAADFFLLVFQCVAYTLIVQRNFNEHSAGGGGVVVSMNLIFLYLIASTGIYFDSVMRLHMVPARTGLLKRILLFFLIALVALFPLVRNLNRCDPELVVDRTFRSLAEAAEQPVRVGRLSLHRETMVDFSRRIRQLCNLEKLRIEQCRFEMVPAAIGDLDRLKILVVKDCRTLLVSPAINRLSLLEELDLSGNSLSSLPEDFSGMVNLRSINLSGNFITKLPESLVALPRLERIVLTGNLPLVKEFEQYRQISPGLEIVYE